MKKAIPAALLIMGLLLLYFGYNEYQSFESEVSEFFTGSPSDRAKWMLIIGAGAAIAGVSGLLRQRETI